MTRDDKTPTLWQVLTSVLAAFFGVQSEAKRQRDFTHGKPHQFIMLGILATIAFILLVFGLVKLILTVAGQ